MNKQEMANHVAVLREAVEVLTQIANLATDRKGEWAEKCEVLLVGTRVSGGYKSCSAELSVYLESHSKPYFAHEAKERKRKDRDNANTRKFAAAILAHFKATATRGTDDPGKLIFTIGNVTVELSGYPTGVSYSCEKKCVALLPNGKTVNLEEVPVEA